MLSVVATAASCSGTTSTEACSTWWRTTAGIEAITHGHRQNDALDARTTIAVRSMRSQVATCDCCKSEHRPARPTGAAAGDAEAALPVGRGQVARAGICGDEAADDTFP